METSTLSVALVDENEVRAAVLEEGLREAGIGTVVTVSEMTDLLRRLVAITPDVIIIDLQNPSRDVLEQMFQVSRVVSRPVAMFVDNSDRAMIEAAIDAGVSAYVVDGLKKERVRPIVEMAISRFNAFSRLHEELAAAKTELAERKVIERAKGVLMKSKKLDEEQAYAALRKAAMDQNRKLVDIAASVVSAAALLE